MGCIIAMAGKGGTGKTTVASLIIRGIKEAKAGSILAIDADPNSNLGEVLGLKPGRNIGTILDEISLNPEIVPSGMTKERFIEYQVQSAIQEEEGFDILSMGKPEGPGCYCYVNNVLRSVMSGLIKDYDYIIIDNEAGLEHLSRRTSRYADMLVVVSDASKIGLRSAQRINQLALQLKFEVKKRFILINRFKGNIKKAAIEETGLDYLGCLPPDPLIEKLSLRGESIFSLRNKAAILIALNTLGEKIWKRN
ncbi:MAG: AAA family ATPase [Candidatus Omnitrophica bacterium]|jgi:CO dehydrogenase maturation factor|nr:AAA family ATPase [Candidatus Omnitrophota bacterium]